MSMYGPHDPFGQRPPDPYGQQPPDPANGPGPTPPDPYQGPSGYPDDQPGGYPDAQPSGYPDAGSYNPSDPYATQPASGTPYSPAGPNYPPPPPPPGGGPTGFMPPQPPQNNNNNTTLWVVGGVAAVVLLVVAVLGGVLIVQGSSKDTDGDSADAPASSEEYTADEPSTEPITEDTPTAESTTDPFAGYAENDPIRGEVGDCVYATPTNEEETEYEAELVDCSDDKANAYFYDTAEGTLDEGDCPDSEYGKVQFWYWVDMAGSTTEDYVLCGYWIAK